MVDKKENYRFLSDKKAQGMSITTIILIILGIVVLVTLILGFTLGWGSFKSWLGSSNNVGQIVTQCSIACSTNQKHSHCYEQRILKTDKEKLEEVSCYTLSKGRPEFGVKKCSEIGCGIYDSAGDASAECSLNNWAADKEVYYIGNAAKITKEICRNL